MRIGIQTWGSYGDVRPFLALSGGLAAAGHEVTLYVTSIDDSDYSAAAQRLGVRLKRVGTIEMRSREDLYEVGRRIVSDRNTLRQMKTIMREFFDPYADEMYRAALELCDGNDLILGHAMHHPVQSAALKRGKPYGTVVLFHGLVPTEMRPPILLPNLGRGGNRLFWGLIRFAINRFLRHHINDFRERHGLPDVRDCFDEVWISTTLNLIGVSSVFCEHPWDWGPHHRVCGFFDAPALLNEGEVSPDLQRFIDGGAPPVFMGFGSMMILSADAQRETIEIFMEAARLAGCRAIIQATLWRECGLAHDERFYFVDTCPHSQVFPQCLAVVHHGGSGTTQAATKAGVPSVIVIHLADQEGWAHETRRIGIAPRAIRRHRLTARRLADRIGAVMNSPAMQARAREAGEAARREDGVVNAVQFVEQIMGRPFPCDGLPHA